MAEIPSAMEVAREMLVNTPHYADELVSVAAAIERDRASVRAAALEEAAKVAASDCLDGRGADAVPECPCEANRLARRIRALINHPAASDDASRVVVCDHCPDYPHPLNDDDTECKNPRAPPATPHPQEPPK